MTHTFGPLHEGLPPEDWQALAESHPDWHQQLAEFEAIVNEAPCAVCESPNHTAVTHA